MTSFQDVPADLLIQNLSKGLQDNDAITAPQWAEFAKTGTHRERPPVQGDWWYVRSAAVLRKVALKGPIGANHMAQLFGGPKDRGVKPNRAVSGSRKVSRCILQQLTAAGYIIGKILTPSGQSLLDEMAHSVRAEAEAKYPELARY
ncbi:MAG: 30S ribosomal protein S19e [Methanobacteriota archaeon]|nr:MAG: 30S ribosomal protein S19e [Euryarchaeota archaeon]